MGSEELNSNGQDYSRSHLLSTLPYAISKSHSREGLSNKNSTYFIWISKSRSFSLFSILRSTGRTVTNGFNLKPPISQQNVRRDKWPWIDLGLCKQQWVLWEGTESHDSIAARMLVFLMALAVGGNIVLWDIYWKTGWRPKALTGRSVDFWRSLKYRGASRMHLCPTHLTVESPVQNCIPVTASKTRKPWMQGGRYSLDVECLQGSTHFRFPPQGVIVRSWGNLLQDEGFILVFSSFEICLLNMPAYLFTVIHF